ncbi:MAG: cellulase family glycosylhydrolase [Polyangiaceae bacterium]|nr:cellulase family glycosylhydrolase [Polyangiaceae bacterium]
MRTVAAVWLVCGLAGPSGCGAGEAASRPPAPGVHATGATAAPLDAGPFAPLATSGDAIVDAAGRRVILRGLEHHALQDVRYQGREVLPGDYPLIGSWGMTTLRMALSWSRIEPTPHAYDAAYLDEVEAALDAAHAAGLTVVLEWHQDLWGKCAREPDDPAANGAPDWTCPASYQPSLLGYWQLFDRFWANEDGLFDAFVEAWGQVVDRLGAHPAVVGYDLLNEPQGNDPSPVLERDRWYPALRALVPALRARGASGLFFVGAPGIRNETLELYTEPLVDLGPGVVYAPHLYSSWIRLYLFHLGPDPTVKARDFELAAEQATELGLPLWNGEWGVNLELDGALGDLELHVGLEDQYRVGSSYWAFDRAIPGQGDASISGAQALLEGDRSVRQAVVDRLSRPYPIAVPGELESLSFDFASQRLELRFAADGGAEPLVLYAPARHLSAAVCLEVEGPAGARYDVDPERERLLVLPGGPGEHLVRLAPCPWE